MITWEVVAVYSLCGLSMVGVGWWLIWLTGRSARELRKFRQMMEDERESR